MYGIPFGGIYVEREGGRMEPVAKDGEGNPLYQMSLRGAEATSLADLTSIHGDLASAHKYCEMLGALDAGDELATPIFEALIVTYARPFVSGRSAAGKGARRKVGELISMLSDQQRQHHARALQLRNQHVGHRVSDDAQSFVLASFNLKGEFLGISMFSTSLGSEGPTIESLHEITRILLEAVEVNIAAEQSALEDFCRDHYARAD